MFGKSVAGPYPAGQLGTRFPESFDAWLQQLHAQPVREITLNLRAATGLVAGEAGLNADRLCNPLFTVRKQDAP